MDCTSTGVNDNRLKQFNKIKFVNTIANSIIQYGVNCGIYDFFDRVDLNCGAIPEGEFEQVIDLSSPHQFLQLYTQIAERRFACAIIMLLTISNNQSEPAIKQFINSIGKDNRLQNVTSPKQVYEMLDLFILDGMPCDETKEIVSESENEIVWKKLIDTHKPAWEKFEGSVHIYYDLQKDFIDGLLTDSDFEFLNENNEIFRIRKK